MLQEIKDLQRRAVSELLLKSAKKQELTFRAPTGSGKTYMMADFMNQVLAANSDVVFLVSTLSKGDLAGQNYRSFCKRREENVFPKLNPYLISTEISGEETLYIPTDYNVYVLPRDLFKKNGRLMAGPMTAFLEQLTRGELFGGKNQRIYLIKDECHQATNNLDEISPKFFAKVFNFSATPNLKRGQLPEVQITDEEAVQAKLIKRVEFGDDADTVEQAICKFEEIKQQYLSLDVNPCLIIQISNKDKAEEEWLRNIKPILYKTEHQRLKWMLIVDKDKDCDTNDELKKLKVEKWKEYAKLPASTIDVIIFKMVISEGWDIPRACMLYQVRDTKSKQLDEQVMGRVRRNPRLLDFEQLNAEQQELSTTAWIWGIPPQERTRSTQVSLWNDEAIQSSITLKTIRLKSPTERKDFDVKKFFEQRKNAVAPEDIFTLYHKLQGAETDLQDLCYTYAANSVDRWKEFMMNIGAVRHQYNQYICNYEESMVIAEKETSFPARSYYLETGNKNSAVKSWVWRKTTNGAFTFDSDAESEWAGILQEVATKYSVRIEPGEFFNEETRYLWGKNFLPNSEIRYEYYADGVHSSYPDFVMKDHKGRIHLFEVKSVNRLSTSTIDSTEYEDKVRQLKDCYRVCSKKLDGYIFYLPLLKDDTWQITRFRNGEEDMLTEDSFRDSLK